MCASDDPGIGGEDRLQLGDRRLQAIGTGVDVRAKATELIAQRCRVSLAGGRLDNHAARDEGGKDAEAQPGRQGRSNG